MLKTRYRRITFFFARVIASLITWELILPRLGMRQWSLKTRPGRLKKTAVDFRALAIQMGGVMIKVGQFLSTRADVLPEEITRELSGLQDEVPPEKFSDIRRVAENELGATLENKFIEFDEKPVAAASLGQVHCARLCRTETTSEVEEPGPYKFCQVVVKIQRPNIEQVIEIDLAALRTVGKWLQRYRPIKKRANVPALLNEFSRTLYEEIDYNAEGSHAEVFAKNFQGLEGIRIPSVIWSHTTKRVLTLEDVTAIKITDYEAITEAGITRSEVAKRLLDTYLKQIFEDGFFHADPHPGNLFVSPLSSMENEKYQWQLIFVDFGMVGRVPESTRQGLRELLMGMGTRDADRIIQAYKTLDFLLPDADLDLLRKANEKVFAQFWGKSMSELRDIPFGEMHEFMEEFRELLYDMPFQVPQDFLFLARTVSILSGLCTGLDPEFNVWNNLAPYAQKLIASEGIFGSKSWIDELGIVFQKIIGAPGRIMALVERIERGNLEVRSGKLEYQVRKVELSIRRLGGAVIVAALILGGVQLYLASQFLAAGLFWVGGALLSLVVFFFNNH
jgi:predicted unusual protein kinase regulating ubiquinone biosynthesis (AarF/ABC1/UbiB family)